MRVVVFLTFKCKCAMIFLKFFLAMCFYKKEFLILTSIFIYNFMWPLVLSSLSIYIWQQERQRKYSFPISLSKKQQDNQTGMLGIVSQKQNKIISCAKKLKKARCACSRYHTGVLH